MGYEEGVLMRRLLILLSVVVVLSLVVLGCSSSAEVAGEADESAVPDDIAALTEAWGEAVDSGGGAVTDLYQTGGYHLYGAQQIAYDDIASFLEAPTESGEWLTAPYLLVNRGDELFVVARGARSAGTFFGSITFVIARGPDGVPEIASTAWVLASS